MKIQQFFQFCSNHIEKIYYKVYYIITNIMGRNGGDRILKKIGAIIAAVAAAALIAFIAWDGWFNKSSEKSFFAMDTVITAAVSGKDSDSVIPKIEECVNGLDVMLSRHNESSEISRLNKNSGGILSAEISEYFRTLLDICKKSGGAFDVTLGAVSDLWSFGKNPQLPDEAELQKVLSECGYENVTLSGNSITLSSGKIDFGAVGKGIALDEIRSILNESKVNGATVSVGGSVLVYGKETVKVGIRDPYGNAGRSIAALPLSDICVSTSGSYERRFEENGKSYHHILDPETGYPVDNGLVSVTIISESGLLSDALSTACFVLGIEKGMALAESYGCEAVFITENKQIYATDSVASEIEITDSSYTLMKYEN